MIYIREYPTQLRLKELFDYIDGNLIWKSRPRSDFKTSQGYGAFSAKCVGEIAKAGKVSGYWVVKINGSAYRTHRRIWIWVNGDIDISEEIDHEDGDSLNYSIGNLRIAERVQNVSNRGAQTNSKSGIKGICWDKSRGKWCAQIKLGDKKISKRFSSINDAISFIRSKREQLHGEFHNHGECGIIT